MAIIPIDTLRKEITRRQDEIFEWLKELLRFPSENCFPDGGERDAQRFIYNECEKEGWKADRFSPLDVEGITEHPSWLQGRNYGNGRDNVVAVWKGSGKSRSILLSGHVDVASFERGAWNVTEPFSPIIKDGKLYGRGAADMKGGLAACFWAAKILKDLNFRPEGDVIFESLVDEEFAGGNGTLASRLKGYNADLAIYPEPSGMKVSPACLGGFLGDIVIKGGGGMPFTGHEIPNPLEAAARIIQIFPEWKKHWDKKNSHPLFIGENKQLDLVLWNVRTKEEDECLQMGTPRLVKLAWIVWGYPGLSEEDFYKEFRSFWDKYFNEEDILKHFTIDIVPAFHYVKPWETDPQSTEVREVIKAYEEFTEGEAEIAGAPFSCDMAIYGEAGNPVVILGPRGDNLHAPDEWVLTEDILNLTGIFARLIQSWCS